MLSILKNIILTVIGFIFMIFLIVILVILNLGMLLITGGDSYGDFSGDKCIEYLSYNFDTNFVNKDDSITCHIENLFPEFLSQHSFSYTPVNNYVSKIKRLGLTETKCEDGVGVCFKGVYKNGSHYIQLDEDESRVKIHRVSF